MDLQLCVCRGMRRVLNVTNLGVAFLIPLLSGRRLYVRHASRAGWPADVGLEKAMAAYVVFKLRRRATSRSQLQCIFKEPWLKELSQALLDQGELLQGSSERFEVLEVRGVCSRREDVVWSGGNAEGSPVFAFFMKVGCSTSICIVNCMLACLPLCKQ
ncbi:hypothetical protein Taro_010403 [Colocasia esculenta]|uniref:Uncharacterized protein n=1 Tax=Colocasia esculenta TaxID=4460 RepID=A0A843U863_COLES|nr:hypothetical protein [Colocasia esculenta]